MTSTTAPIERPRISACIIAFNEAGRIGDCLASLAFCDEIVVVDSYSTDATVAIAQAMGARVLQRPFDGFRSQKQYAVEQARHDWVLCLDADERVGETLKASILQARANGFGMAAGFRFEPAEELVREGRDGTHGVIAFLLRSRGASRAKPALNRESDRSCPTASWKKGPGRPASQAAPWRTPHSGS